MRVSYGCPTVTHEMNKMNEQQETQSEAESGADVSSNRSLGDMDWEGIDMYLICATIALKKPKTEAVRSVAEKYISEVLKMLKSPNGRDERPGAKNQDA